MNNLKTLKLNEIDIQDLLCAIGSWRRECHDNQWLTHPDEIKALTDNLKKIEYKLRSLK